jgi:hypothetical protein
VHVIFSHSWFLWNSLWFGYKYTLFVHLSLNGCHESERANTKTVSLELMYWSRYLWIRRDWAGLLIAWEKGEDLSRWC